MDLHSFGMHIGTEKFVIVQLGFGILNNKSEIVIPAYTHYRGQVVDKCGKKAKDNVTSNYEYLFFDTKRMIGQDINSQLIKDYVNHWPFSIDCKPDDQFRKVYYRNSDGEPICPIKVIGDLLEPALKDKSENPTTIAYPSNFTLTQKLALMKAVEKASIKIDKLILVPRAIAGMMSYHDAVKPIKDTTKFVFIFGAGAVETAVIKYFHSSKTYQVLVSNGDSTLGGRDFDLVIAKIIQEKLISQLGSEDFQKIRQKSKVRFKILKVASEIKEALSTTETETLPLSDIDENFEDDEITSLEFDQRSENLVQRIREICQLTVSEANNAEITINGGVLFGMASNMAFVKNMIQDILGTKIDIHKSTSMRQDFARGAALSPLFNTNNIIYYSIGIELPNKEIQVIFGRNLPLPSKISVECEVIDNDHLVIPIYEGILPAMSDNTPIADLVIEIPKGQMGIVIINFSLDESGILHVKAEMEEKQELTSRINYRYQFD